MRLRRWILIALVLAACSGPLMLPHRVERGRYIHVFVDACELYARLYGDYIVETEITPDRVEEYRTIVQRSGRSAVRPSKTDIVVAAQTDLEPFFSLFIGILPPASVDSARMLSAGFLPQTSGFWALVDLDRDRTTYLSLTRATDHWVCLAAFERFDAASGTRSILSLRNEMNAITRSIRVWTGGTPPTVEDP